MGKIEEMLLSNGVIVRDGANTSYVEGSLVTNSLVVRNSAGWVTHRIERGALGGLIVRNVSTGMVEARLS